MDGGGANEGTGEPLARPRRQKKRTAPSQEQPNNDIASAPELQIAVVGGPVITPFQPAPPPPSPREVPVCVVPNIPESTPEPSPVKPPKVKTRKPAKPAAEVSEPPAANAAEEQKHIYCIDAESYDVFHRLLVRNQGSFSWVDFMKVSLELESLLMRYLC